MNKFGRSYKIIMELNDGGEAIIIEPPLTIEFNVVRSTYSALNTMQLRIRNLAEGTRNRIFQDKFDKQTYKRVILQIGYDQLSVVFRGNIFQANHTRQGTDIVTFIDSRDGAFDAVLTQTNKTLAGGTTKKAVVEALFSDFPNLKKGIIGGIGGENRRPVVLDGNTFNLIKERTNNKGYIEFETLNFLADDEAIDGEVFLINSETGLIGTPKRDNSYIKVETIMEPRIIMSQIVQIESDIAPQYDGQYKVIGVEHSGTISEAIGGSCTSRFSLLAGSNQFGTFKKIDKNGNEVAEKDS